MIFGGHKPVAVKAAIGPTTATFGGLTFTTAFGPATTVASVRDADKIAPLVDTFTPEAVAAFEFDDLKETIVASSGTLSEGAQAPAWSALVHDYVAVPVISEVSANMGGAFNPFSYSSDGSLGGLASSSNLANNSASTALLAAAIPPSDPTTPLTPDPGTGSVFGPPPVAVPLPPAVTQGIIGLGMIFGALAVRCRYQTSLQPV